jgi:hypothetical protein
LKLKISKPYISVSEWVVAYFNSAKDVIQLSDKKAGIIILKGSRNYAGDNQATSPFHFVQYFTLKIYTKDSKIKLVLSDIRIYQTLGDHEDSLEHLVSDNFFYKKNGEPKQVALNHQDQTFKLWNFIKSGIIENMNSSDDDW